jgi:hypothetical protein
VHILTTDPLFPWDRMADSPSLLAIRQMLDSVPDTKLLRALQIYRGHGRNDYPVHVLWRTHLLRYFLRHPTMEACLADLARNAHLRALVGLRDIEEIPKAFNMSRFQAVLGRPEHLELMREAFNGMLARLVELVPDLGRSVAGDASCLSARADSAKADSADQDSLPQPNGGVKQYFDDQGKVCRTYQWFGYKMHLLVDTKHEMILSYKITEATAADNKQLPGLLQEAQAILPPKRMEILAFDKAADDGDIHELLHQHGIKPLIEIRSLWRDQSEQKLPGHDATVPVVHDEAGTVYCYDTVSDPPVKKKMAFIGHEKNRGTLKYRCPAKHGGFQCPSMEKCNGQKVYGLTVRVKQSTDLRRFPPIPRATREFARLYKTRSAVERVNARVKLFWGADDGNVTGARRFHAHLNTVMLVHMTFATLLAASDRYEGKTLSPVKLSTIARALREKSPEASGPQRPAA